MAWQLDEAHLALVAHAAHPQAAPLEPRAVLRVEPVVAVVVFQRVGPSVEARGERAVFDPHRMRLADERAGERGHHEPVGLRAALFVIGVSDPENVARELDDRVLEATSRPHQRHAALARVADRLQRAVQADVGAAG